MLKAIGFLLEFKNKASKGLERVFKDVLKLDKLWERSVKGFGKWTKVLSLNMSVLKAKVLEAIDSYKKGAFSLEHFIDKVEDTFGTRVASIMRLLTRPSTAIAAAAGVALKAGMEMEGSLKGVQKEATYTASEFEYMRGAINQVSSDVGASISRVGAVARIMAKRGNLPVEEFAALGSAIIRVADIADTSEMEISELVLKYRKLYGMNNKEILDMLAGADRVAKESYTSLQELMSQMGGLDSVLIRFNKDVQKEAVAGMIQLHGALAESYEDGAQIAQLVFQGMVDDSSEAMAQISYIMSYGGEGAAEAYKAALEKGDVMGAYAEFTKGLRNLDTDAFKSIESAMGGVMPFDIATLEKLQRVDESRFGAMISAYEKVGDSAKYIADRHKDTRTITDRLLMIWEKIKVILEPIGTMLVWVGHQLLNVVEPIVNVLAAFVQTDIGRMFLQVLVVVSAIAVAISSIGAVLTGLVVIVATLAGLLAAVFSPVVLTVLAIAVVVALIATYWDEIAGSVSSFFSWVWSGVKNLASWMWDMMLSFANLAATIFNPMTYVKAGVAFGRWLASKISEIMSSMIGAAVDWVIEKVTSLGSALVGLFKSLVGSVVNDLIGWIPGMGGGEPATPVSPHSLMQGRDYEGELKGGPTREDRGFAHGGLVMPQPGGSQVTVGEGGQPEFIADPSLMRHLIGVDDITEAIWGAAYFLAEQLAQDPAATPAPALAGATNFNMQSMRGL